MSRTGAIRSGLPRLSLATILLLAFAGIAASQQPANPPPAASTPNTPKPKKVYTDDDIQPSTTGPPATTKPASSPAQPGKDPNAEVARTMRARLEKLAAQIKDADRQIDELKRFQAGELSGDAGRQLHKGYNTIPIPDQIAKLEQKRLQLLAQVDATYDAARKKGIQPGQLR